MIAALCLIAVQAPTVAPPRELLVEPVPHHLGVAALGAEGGNRLVALTGRTLRLIDEPDLRLALSGDSLLWTIADLDGDGGEEFLVLVDGDALRRVERVTDAATGRVRIALSEPILSGLKAVPPRGTHPAAFVRDLDGDGRLDLLLPLGARVRILLGTADGFRPGPDLGALARLGIDTGSGVNLFDRVERSLSIPGVTPADVSGDGRPDLVVSDGLLVRQFIASGSGLPEQPTHTLDLSPFRLDPKALDFDLGNVTAVVRTLVVDEWQDLNNDGIEDVVVLGDGRVHSFLGTAQGVSTERPVQSLKLTGNPFYVAAVRMDDDAYRDLVVVRIEDIGLGKMLRAALFSWKIEFDFLVYQGKGDGSFSRRPLYNKTIELKGDSLLSIADQGDRVDALRSTVVRRGCLDGDGLDNDLVTLEPDGALRAWRNVVPPGSPGGRAREKFLRDALGQGNKEVSWQLEDLATWVLGRTSALISMTRDRPADVEVRLADDWEPPHTLALRDLDGDGRDEAIVLRRLKVGEEPARLVGFSVTL
ncbi:MAG: VCBS repeat-containing protein [Planctomycetota bacterium]|nr:VCBS repeat-containing protein [Planctomycetota bacterium]